MDSTGLRTLLGAARTYPNVKLQGPLQPPVQRLLELTQTLTILPFNELELVGVDVLEDGRHAVGDDEVHAGRAELRDGRGVQAVVGDDHVQRLRASAPSAATSA